MPRDPLQGKATPFSRRVEVEGDQPFLEALCIGAFAEQFAPMNLPPPMLAMLTRQQFQAQSAGYRAQFPAARHEIIEADGVGVGRLITDCDGERLQLIDIVFTPASRGQGLGAALIGELMDEARAAGLPIGLHVAHTNVRAAALYARLGFETTADDGVHQAMRWTPT